MRAYLRVKAKSLAAEAQIIRAEEHRARDRGQRVLRASLRAHRVYDVRREARAALLALAFLRGLPVTLLEGPSTRTVPQWERVEALVKKYGEGDVRDRGQQFSEWKSLHPRAA